MTNPKSARSSVPSSCLPRLAPANAPATPAAVNTIAQGHFTVPSRAWLASPHAALGATATAEEPMATWAEDADEIDEKRHGEDRASSSDEPERQPDDGARGE